MRRYKVALICDWYLPRIGGLELHLRDLARELNARGHQAHIICATPGRAEVDGIQVHRLDVPLLPMFKTIRSSAALPALEELLRRENFDIVHAHTVLSPLALCGTYLARKMGIPSVLTEHSVLREGGVVFFRALSHVYPWVRWPTVLSAVSSYVAEDMRRMSGRDDVFVLLNATSAAEWQVRREEGNEVRVTSVMRFTKRKRPVDLIRIIPRVLSRLPAGLRPRFTLVGDGPQRARVEREVRRLGVGAYVELLGLRPRHEIREILARSSVFALPSYKEALSIVALEARAAGLPVVARTPNGVSEVIEHGVHGFLAKDDDEFAAYLAQLVEDRTMRQRMSESTRRGLERFGWERSIERHLDIYSLAALQCQKVREVGLVQPDEGVIRLRAFQHRSRYGT